MADQAKEPEVTVESLRAELDKERTAHQVTKGERDTALKVKADADENLAQATTVIEGQKKTIEEQEARIIELQTAPAAFPVIEVGKVKYEVRVGSFKYAGETYTVEQLLKDAKLQKELVGKGVGFLVKKEV